MANAINPNDPKNKKPGSPVTAAGLAGGADQPTIARQNSTPDGKPPAFVGRAARMDANQAKSELANRNYSTGQLASFARNPIPGVNMAPSQANYEIARRAGAAMGLTDGDGNALYKDSHVTGQIRSAEEGRRINAGFASEGEAIDRQLAKNRAIVALHPAPTGGYGVNSARSGFEQSSNMRHTQMNPVLTPERIAVANGIQQQGGSLSTGVSPTPVAQQQFGGKIDRPFANRPVSAEGAAWQVEQAKQNAAFKNAPAFQPPPVQPQAPYSTVDSKIKSATDSVKGSMRQAVEKGKGALRSGAGMAKDVVKAGRNTAALATLASTAGAAVDGFQTPTEQYRERFGLETDDPSLAGDLGVRAIGLASDVGANMPVVGSAIKQGIYRDQQGAGQAERMDAAVSDGAGDLAGLGTAALFQKAANTVPGKLGKVLQLGAGIAGYSTGKAGADYTMEEGGIVARNEAERFDDPQKPQSINAGNEQQQAGDTDTVANKEPGGGSGYMIGKDGKRVDFNPATGSFEGDLLGDRAGKSAVNVGAGGLTGADYERRIAEGYGKYGDKGRPEKGAGAIFIGDSNGGMESTASRNARLTAESAADQFGNMSDRAKAELMMQQRQLASESLWKNNQLGMDASQLSLEEQKAQSLAQGVAVDSAVKQSALIDSTDARTLRKQIASETDPQKRAALEDQLSYLSGNSGSSRFSAVAMDDGSMGILDRQRGSIVPASSLAAM